MVKKGRLAFCIDDGVFAFVCGLNFLQFYFHLYPPMMEWSINNLATGFMCFAGFLDDSLNFFQGWFLNVFQPNDDFYNSYFCYALLITCTNNVNKSGGNICKNIKYYTIRASQLEESLEIETRGATFQLRKSKPDPKSTVLASSSKVAWKKELADQYRKHEMIKQHILQGKEADLEILNKVLNLGDKPTSITEEHLILCLEIYNKRTTLALPVPRTKHVISFTKLVGRESYKEENKVSGCYCIRTLFKGCSKVTGLRGIESYIGQTNHLGNRVKQHAKGVDLNTKFFISSCKGKGVVVDLFIVDKDLQIPGNLTIKQFITILEQYLIIKLKPTLNKKLLATPGIMWSPEIINKFLKKMSHPVYAYRKEDNGKLVLIQIFQGSRAVGTSLGFTKSFFINLKSRKGGWYKDKVYFTDIKLDNTESNILTMLKFKELINTVNTGRMGFSCAVIDEMTGDKTIYISMRAITRAIGIDAKGIREKCKSGKLYKRRYRFELLNDS